VGERAGCEVISVPKIVRIPATPGWLLGVANLRGSLVPLFDLKSLFEFSASSADEERFALIFDRGDQAVGILVADYPKPLVGLEAVAQRPPLPAAARDFVGAVWRHGRSVWLEFEHRRFFESLAQRMSANS
jgi:twitching motility protein PilI